MLLVNNYSMIIYYNNINALPVQGHASLMKGIINPAGATMYVCLVLVRCQSAARSHPTLSSYYYNNYNNVIIWYHISCKHYCRPVVVCACWLAGLSRSSCRRLSRQVACSK